MLFAFVGLAIGAGVYRLAKLAFSRMDGLTNTNMTNAAAATTFALLLVMVGVVVVWTRFVRKPGRRGLVERSAVDPDADPPARLPGEKP